MGNCVLTATEAGHCGPTATPEAQLTPLIDGWISYELYGDAQGWANWQAWLEANEGTAEPREKSNAYEFEGYALKMVCDFTNATNK